LKVLIVYPKFYVYGGGELLIVRLCNFLSSQGIENAILTTEMMPEIQKDLTQTQIILAPIKKYKSLFHAHYQEMIYPLRSALNQKLMEIQKDYDLINVHNNPAHISLKGVQKPVVWMCNEPEFYIMDKLNLPLLAKAYLFYLKKLEKWYLKHYISQNVVADEFNFQRFVKLFKRKPSINNYGIDYSFFSQKPVNLKNSYADSFVVLHVGMLTPLKNQLNSLEVINELKDQIKNIKLLLLGSSFDSAYSDLCKNYIREKQLENHVELVGHVNKEQLREYFYIADVMLHPILEQGGWLSPFEMLCTGKPIVVAKTMTAASIIEKEQIGTVSENYSATLLDLWKNKDQYLQKAEKGRTYVQNNLTWEQFGERMKRIFLETIHKYQTIKH